MFRAAFEFKTIRTNCTLFGRDAGLDFKSLEIWEASRVPSFWREHCRQPDPGIADPLPPPER